MTLFRWTTRPARLAGLLAGVVLAVACGERGRASREPDEVLSSRQPGLSMDWSEPLLVLEPSPDPDFRDPGVRDDDPVHVEPPDPSRPDWLAEWLDGDDDPTPASGPGGGGGAGVARGTGAAAEAGPAAPSAGDEDPAAATARDLPPVADRHRARAHATQAALAALDLPALIDQLRDPPSSVPAWSALGQRPGEQVVPALAEALEAWRADDPAVGDAQRSLAYDLLGKHRAADSATGFAALLAGLDDPAGEVSCVQALGHAPASRRHEAAAAISGRLLAEGTSAPLRERAFRALSWLDALDDRSRDLARRRLSNRAAPRSERSAAAGLLLWAEPDPSRLEWLVEATDDAERDELVVGSVFARIRRLDDPHPLRPVLQELLAARLASPAASVRRMAAGALPLAFGASSLVRDEAGALVVHPDLAGPLAAARAREDDATVRAALDEILALLERGREQAGSTDRQPSSSPPR